MTMRALFTQTGDTTSVRFTSTYATVQAMQQVLDMGVEEGLRAAMGQMDALLTA